MRDIDSLVKRSVNSYMDKKYRKDLKRIISGKKHDAYFKKYTKEYIEELANYFESLGDYDNSQLLLMIRF